MEQNLKKSAKKNKNLRVAKLYKNFENLPEPGGEILHLTTECVKILQTMDSGDACSIPTTRSHLYSLLLSSIDAWLAECLVWGVKAGLTAMCLQNYDKVMVIYGNEEQMEKSKIKQ
jgi:hypothetical protein